MLGSLTVLPAVLSKLGDRVEKGRVPFIGRIKAAWARRGLWSRIVDRVLRRPLLSALVSAGVLVALAIPALGMETSPGGTDDFSRDMPVMQTYDRIQAAFPSEGSSEMVVVKADDVTAPAGRDGHRLAREQGRGASGPVRGRGHGRAQRRQDGRRS